MNLAMSEGYVDNTAAAMYIIVVAFLFCVLGARACGRAMRMCVSVCMWSTKVAQIIFQNSGPR